MIIKKQRHKVVCAVYAIVEKDNKILLSLRKNTGFRDGFYSLVAGHLEANETIEEAMLRELKEEADMDVNPESMRLVTVMHRLGEGDRDDYMDFFFLIKDYDGVITNMEVNKCANLEFFSRDNFPDNTIDYVLKAIENMDNNITCDSF